MQVFVASAAQDYLFKTPEYISKFYFLTENIPLPTRQARSQ